MTTMTRPLRSERLADASVVRAAVDIAGARHEVLPPRRSLVGGPFTPSTLRAPPP